MPALKIQALSNGTAECLTPGMFKEAQPPHLDRGRSATDIGDAYALMRVGKSYSTVKQLCVRIHTRIIVLFKNCILREIYENWQLRGRKGAERWDKCLGVTETGGNRRRLGEEKGEGLDPLLCTFPVLWLIKSGTPELMRMFTASIIFFVINLYALFWLLALLKSG